MPSGASRRTDESEAKARDEPRVDGTRKVDIDRTPEATSKAPAEPGGIPNVARKPTLEAEPAPEELEDEPSAK